MNWKQIGSEIQATRKRKGLSQQDLGKRIGSTYQYISQIENGYPCSVKMLNKIAEALESEWSFSLKPISHRSTN